MRKTKTILLLTKSGKCRPGRHARSAFDVFVHVFNCYSAAVNRVIAPTFVSLLFRKPVKAPMGLAVN